MSSTTLELNCFEAFENEINLTLCNDIIRFVIQVSDMKEDEKKAIRTDFENRIIWYDNRNNNDFQEKYQFRYLGEMLERYEENFGSDICDLRAIALALAYTQPLISANMFIGTQQKDFIEKVRLTAGNDIYLEGALHLIDMAQKEQSAWLAEREEKSFDKTEELMFFISLYFQPETIYEKMKTEAIRLLGNEKTISVYSNIGIYCWLIRRFYSCVKADRKKNTVLFKAFVSLPGSWAKEESMPYKILTLHGYSTTEIAFLNYSVLLYSFVPNSIKSTSIVAEKIAVAFCKAVLADPQSQPEEGCELLRYALIKYNEFPIKCFGQKGIWDTMFHLSFVY